MDVIFLFIGILILNQVLLDGLSKKFSFLNKKLLNGLFFYHLLFFGIFFGYTMLYGSDSLEYYVSANVIGIDWDLFSYTGTDFIDNFAAMFVMLGISYPG